MTTLYSSTTVSNSYTVRIVRKDDKYCVVQVLGGTIDTLTFDTLSEAKDLFDVLTNVGYF